jgi:DNA-binding response OmpR family regulator
VISKTTVLILTASDKPEDKQTASKIGADAYFVKPSKFEDLKKLVKSIETDWLGIKKTKPGVSAKKAASQGAETQTAQPVLISESALHAVAEPVA